MGWTFTRDYRSKAGFTDYLLDMIAGDDRQVLQHSLRNNHLWVLLQEPGTDPVILLLLLAREDGAWGYKGLAEADGPMYYDCPLKYLERAPEVINCFTQNHNDSGRSWRSHVRDYHDTRNARLRSRPTVGSTITLTAEKFGAGYAGQYKVTDDLGRRGLVLNGYLRMKAHQIKHAEYL